ncbi:MAG: hypothetical protein AAB225_28540 [Acidobacteriota bacterium]
MGGLNRREFSLRAAGLAAPRPVRQNVILVLADNLGWAERGCYGNRCNRTPEPDGLAAEGGRFTEADAAPRAT